MFSNEDHPDFPKVPDEAVLWRYMDLSRFLSLLEDEALHFARSDYMSDRWEGAFGHVNIAERPRLYGEHYSKMFPTLSVAFKNMKRRIYLNCWYESGCESAAMWGLYQADGRGIAVRTTWGDLKASITSSLDIFGGRVKYVDYTTTFIPENSMFAPFMHKRQSFTHEQELRLVYWLDANTGPNETGEVGSGGDHIPWDAPTEFGHKVSVDLDRLVGSIYVAPEAPAWFAELMSSLVKRYGHDWHVQHSDLSSDPVW